MSEKTRPEKSSKFRVPTKKFIRKEILIGFVISIAATASGIFLYLEFFSKFGFDQTWKMIQDGNLYSSVIALAAIPNLFVFFIYIKRNKITAPEVF